MTIGSAVRAQEADSTVPLQKSSWGDAKNSEITDYIPDISLDMRGGYYQDFGGSAGQFFGDGLYLDINGKISPHFSYSLNQRLASSYYEDNSGFNGTNWLTITYENDYFGLTFGKDAVFVGSFEYDAYDLDSYTDMNSGFYNTFDCWQWAVSAAWYPADDQEVLLPRHRLKSLYPNRDTTALPPATTLYRHKQTGLRSAVLSWMSEAFVPAAKADSCGR